MFDSVYEKCVELLDKYYDGDLPLKDQGKVVDIISNKFSRSKVKQNLLDEAKASWNSKKVKGPTEDKEHVLEAYEEKYKIPLLKSRVKDLLKEFPIFCRLEHFFIRYLEVSRNDMKLILIMDNETLVFCRNTLRIHSKNFGEIMEYKSHTIFLNISLSEN